MRCWLLLTCCFVIITTGQTQVVINEAGIAPAGGSGSQFIELFNRSGCPVDISCYTIVFSSTSGGGNATGWTIKIPSGKFIAAGSYFLVGGTAGAAGVVSGTGYPTGGAVNSYTGTADLNVGTSTITANAVYMKQGINAGSFPNTKGQISLLNAAGVLVASVAYNNGNNPGTYPLSAYTTCAATGNVKGSGNIQNPGASVNNVTASFSAATNQGIYLAANGSYQTETTLSPGAANNTNGGTQVCSGPVLTSANNISACFSTTAQTKLLTIVASNTPASYNITWDAVPANNFVSVTNAALNSNAIPVIIPGNTAPGIYTGNLTLFNPCGYSCTVSFSVTVLALPAVNAGNYNTICTGSTLVSLLGTPAGGSFSGSAVSANTFIPPAVAGNYSITYTYTDPLSGCTNIAGTTIAVSAPVSSYTTACTNGTPYVFQGQNFTSTGLHTVLLNNANGCTDTTRLYLMVKQTVVRDTAGCDSVIYGNTSYHTSTTLTQTYSSVVTGCDSLVNIVNISIKKSTVKDTAVCLPPNSAVSFLGQSFSASGLYVLHTRNIAGCDSTINLQLTATRAEVIDTSACDSLMYEGLIYKNSITLIKTIASTNGCDSVKQTVNITIKQRSTSFHMACLSPGSNYNFYGQTCTTSGLYVYTLTNIAGCDSITSLYLIITAIQNSHINSCHPVIYNGITYSSSAIIYDTVKSVIIGCDSVIKKVIITISARLTTNLSICARDGDAFLFNGQAIAVSGSYTDTLTSIQGCDSIVNLYIVFKKISTQTIHGCDSVVFNRQTLYANAVFSDTIKSVVTGCDSLVHIHQIIITPSPGIVVPSNILICAGDSIRLTATSSATVQWLGASPGNTIIVAPRNNTTYYAVATDNQGCSRQAVANVIVQHFSVSTWATPNVVVQGNAATIQTSSLLSYRIISWRPASPFVHQHLNAQTFVPDSSMLINIIAISNTGCKDTGKVQIVVQPLDDIYVASAFTPNGDGKNEVVKVRSSGIRELHFQIFNRWGQLMFFTTDKGKGWDGKLNGITQPAGSYVYILKINKAGKMLYKRGVVTLVK